MASGFGTTGSQGRCYPLWQDFSECLSTAEEPKKCFAIREDYVECLHHRKEYSRMNEITRQQAKTAQAEINRIKEEMKAKLAG